MCFPKPKEEKSEARRRERDHLIISFDGEDNNNNNKEEGHFFFFAISFAKGLLPPRMGRDLLSLSLSLSLSLYIIYIYTLWSAVRVWVMQRAFSVSRVMFPPMGKLREGGRFSVRERVSGFAKEKLMLVHV